MVFASDAIAVFAVFAALAKATSLCFSHTQSITSPCLSCQQPCAAASKVASEGASSKARHIALVRKRQWRSTAQVRLGRALASALD